MIIQTHEWLWTSGAYEKTHTIAASASLDTVAKVILKIYLENWYADEDEFIDKELAGELKNLDTGEVYQVTSKGMMAMMREYSLDLVRVMPSRRDVCDNYQDPAGDHPDQIQIEDIIKEI